MEKGYDKLNRKDGEESLRKFVEKENIMQKILITMMMEYSQTVSFVWHGQQKNMVKSG